MKYSYHVPVLSSEVLRFLITDLAGVYFDGTLGGAGHAESILAKLDKKAKYIAVDLDQDALSYAKQRLHKYSNVIYIHANFSDLGNILAQLHIFKIDGLFLDLGLSSHQVDTAKRGFSYMQDGILDMRMNRDINVNARDLLNEASEEDLNFIFYQYGQERKSKAITRQIIEMRQKAAIKTTAQLKAAINAVVPSRFTIKSYARIFQALRITVNHELENLKTILLHSTQYIKRGGRLVVLSYHSLEDRIVKNFLKQKANPCTCPPEFPRCICGLKPEIKILTHRAIRATKVEIQNNPRSRSALLRAGERI